MKGRWRRAEGAVFRRLPDGVLVMSLFDGDPVCITAPGDAVWDELDQPSTIEEIVAGLESRTGAGEAEMRGDVTELLRRLHRLRLVETGGADE